MGADAAGLFETQRIDPRSTDANVQRATLGEIATEFTVESPHDEGTHDDDGSDTGSGSDEEDSD